MAKWQVSERVGSIGTLSGRKVAFISKRRRTIGKQFERHA